MADKMPPVDLALILAFDGSASVTFESFGLIASGTAAALRDETVKAGLLGGPRNACLLTLILWSGPGAEEVLVDWARIDTPNALSDFADQVENVPRIVSAGTTAIGSALLFCETLLFEAPTQADRQVIDIAGDGSSNEGPAPGPIRDRLVNNGVTINGLCILHEEPDLLETYQRDVIGGVGAFALVCATYAEFASAMRQKLRQEIS